MNSVNVTNLAQIADTFPVEDGNVFAFPYHYTIPKPTVKSTMRKQSKRTFYLLKRTIDILLSTAALIVLSPLFLVVSLLIKLESKGPIFFQQERIGRHQRPFKMYKFRSMVVNAEDLLEYLKDKNERDGPVFKIENDPRITKVGAFIRKTCIDELPQLINIIKGDMTIVGPRPPLRCEVDQYTPYQLLRLAVTPGLTCIWQVSDRNMSFDQWVALDLEYIRKRCLLLDIKLILRTFKVVLRVSGDT